MTEKCPILIKDSHFEIEVSRYSQKQVNMAHIMAKVQTTTFK